MIVESPCEPRDRASAPRDLGFVALAHDHADPQGGSARAVLEMAAMWPEAPIYTSVQRAPPALGDYEVLTSPLSRMPVDGGARGLPGIHPAAFASFGTLEHDVVISSSSGWAHAVRTSPETFHAVYCHTPARWLYGGGRRPRGSQPVIRALRRWDRMAARRADLYIAISDEVRRRIKREYGIDATVVHPPVDVERFRPSERGERLLVVSTLGPDDRVDVVVDAAMRAGIGLDVVGTGPALDDLRRRGGPTVTFHGHLPDAGVARLMESCRALCLPGAEDFAIAAVQANAAGKPVVAFAAGGALETVVEGTTGSLFVGQDPDRVLDAIRRCDAIAASPDVIAEHARRFSRAAFRDGLHGALDSRLEQLRGAGAVHARCHQLPGDALAVDVLPANSASARAAVEAVVHPRVLMLGKGWFPNELGGLDRYYRDLLEHLAEATGVVIGAGAAPHERVTGVCDHDRPLPQRLYEFWRASARAADEVDVVDAHFGLYALAPLSIGRLRRKPVVLHFHGPWAGENVAAGDRSALRCGARVLLERVAYRRADQSVVLTSAFRQVLVERYGVRPWNVHVQPPGVDLVHFAPGCSVEARRRLGLDADGFVAVAVRRLVPRMGLEILLDAWEGAVGNLPTPAVLLIVGDGPLRGALADSIRSRGLGDSVRLLGRIADDELADLYRAADVGVVPTLDHEGFGLVVLEAAACGTPSIVTAVGGLPEAVARLDASLAVIPGDPDALGARLLRSVHDRPSRAACRTYAEGYAWRDVAERHRAITRRAAGHGPRDDRLKVVYIDHVAQMSGGEIALLRLLPHLDGVNAHVVLAQDGPLVEQLHLAGISVEVLPLGSRARELRKGDVSAAGVDARVAMETAAYTLRLAHRLRELRPDLVHTNSLKAGVYGSIAAKLAGVPVVWHVRDRIADDYLPESAITLVRHMSRHLATAVVANSKATMATLAADADPTVVYSVVPEVMNRMTPVKRVSDGPMTYGIVGRLAPWKGQDLFLRAFARAFPDGSERAVIVGSALFGEDAYAAGLVELARTLGIVERVEFRGFCHDVWAELARVDVLVHASTIPEPFGQVVLEGMAAGVPVIAAGAGGPAEILDDGVTGVLYEPNDVAQLAGAMRRLLDGQLRERLRTAARREVRRYEPHVVAAELQQLYARVVAPHATA